MEARDFAYPARDSLRAAHRLTIEWQLEDPDDHRPVAFALEISALSRRFTDIIRTEEGETDDDD